MALVNANGSMVIAEITKSANPVANGGSYKAPHGDGCLLKLKSDGTIKYRLVGNAPGNWDEDIFFTGDVSNVRVAEVEVAGTDAEFKFVW